MRDFQDIKAQQEYRSAFYKNKGKTRCLKCDLYNCICQLSLSEWVPIRQIIKEPTHSQKVANCPHRCANADKDCIECYNFSKFKGVVVL